MREGVTVSQRVMTDARRFSEQTVVMLAPSVDDRIRTLAVRHGVSQGRAHRVALLCSLAGAEALTTEEFLRAHAVCEDEARGRHANCRGHFHVEDVA